jgi:type I restriction enzyme M protein
MGQEPPREPHRMPSQLQGLLTALAGPLDQDCSVDVSQLHSVEPVPANAYSSVIGAAPFSGTIAAGSAGADPRAGLQTRRAELMTVALALQALREGGRMALVVPESVLDGMTRAHQTLRRRLVEENTLHAVIRLRAGLYKPRTRAALLVAARGGHTSTVWFCELGSSRQVAELAVDWPKRGAAAPAATGAPASFFVRREAIQPPQYRLGIDHYRCAHPQDSQQPKPHEILHEIAGLEAEILQGIRDLVGLLKG